MKHVTLSAPQVQPSVTCHMAKSVSVDLATGVAHLVIDKCDSADRVVASDGITWTLSEADLATFTIALLASAQVAGQIPAGVIGDAPTPELTIAPVEPTAPVAPVTL